MTDAWASRDFLWPLLLAVLLCPASLAAFTTPADGTAASTNHATWSKPGVKPASLKISGYGILGDRELKRMLRTLELAGTRPEFFTAPFVEDAALILAARIKRDGFLKPAIQIELELEHGGHMRVASDELLDNPLPRPLRITAVHFRIRKGRLYHYQGLEFEGLQAITEKAARAYFIDSGPLLPLKKSRAYTPEKLRHGLNSITDLLDRQGYQEAKAEVLDLQTDDKTGRVTVRIGVHQGPQSIARSVREEFFDQEKDRPAQTRTVQPNKPYSTIWLQDLQQSLKTNEFHNGFPDVTVEVRTLKKQSEGEKIFLDLQADVHRGPKVWIGQVKFEGQKKTRHALLSRRVRVTRGELLDRIKVEEGRLRLAQLGIFDTTDLVYEPVNDQTRDVLYRVKEGKRTDVSLLFGYGSYELLRGGVEFEENNIWGRAHHARLKLVQSFKASSADFTYTMPEFIGKDLDFFLNASGLRREEVSFLREEYGGGMGVHKYFKPYATDASVRYNYQILNAAEVNGIVAPEGATNTTVGAIITELKQDRRDNPLYPRRGYKVFGTLELATEYLGGEANYQRLELATSFHHPLGGGRSVSLGLSQGVILSIGNPTRDLPFNKRFFPGGQNSIRGYNEGEASPRDSAGKIVGAETYTLGTVEFEQALTPKWSLVLFSDSLGFAEHAEQYPFDTGLFSVGGGLRWKTIIGPVRLEYGHNLNPRPGDPSGTIQFSLGFPF